MTRGHALLDRLFGKAEEINGGHVCPTYLYRWTVLRGFGRSVYLHHFVGDDWSLDLHDHPKRFISIGLRGSYIEETPGDPSNPANELTEHVCLAGEISEIVVGTRPREERFRAPWVRTFPAEHRHRLRLEPGRDCWTLVIVLKPVREWGFWRNGTFVPWRTYVRSSDARERRSCP